MHAPDYQPPLSADGLPLLWTPGEVQLQLRDWLVADREERNLSLDDLAARTGLSQKTISEFEASGEISLQDFLVLWGYLDRLDELRQMLAAPRAPVIRSLDELWTLRDFAERKEQDRIQDRNRTLDLTRDQEHGE